MLYSLKKSVSNRALASVQTHAPAFLDRMADTDARGALTHRFWPRGRGYDRSEFTPREIWEQIDDIYANPVRRGLCERPALLGEPADANSRRQGTRQVSARERVNQDPVPPPGMDRKDQFMPNLTVDSGGTIHVTYYDDRRYNVLSDQVDGPGTPMPKFDVVYAYFDFESDEWVETILEADPMSPDYLEPVFDFHRNLYPEYQLRDYTGIDWCPDPLNPGHLEVWTTFMGTSVQDANPEQTVIWSCRIGW